MTRAEILDCLTDRPCDVCRFHESGRCERWDCVFEEKPDDAEADAISRVSVLDTLDTTDEFMDEERTVETYKALLKECYEVLPSVIPQQRVGCWIHTDECDEEWQYRCSICNMPSRSNAHRYCSNCGSYMYGIKPDDAEDCEDKRMTREEAIAKIFKKYDVPTSNPFFFEIIKALSAEPCEDCISRQAVINGVDNYIEKAQSTSVIDDFISFEELVVKVLPPVTPQQKMGRWIPIKTRPLSDKEKEEYADLGYGEDSISFMYDCPLPDDGQEVLISYGGYVCTDIFVRDDSDGCYFEGADIDDVEAWMPLPEPYKAESEDT